MRRQAKALFICVALLTFFTSAANALADAPPSVTIDAPTEVKYQTAHVSGTVNPEGGPSAIYWHFEYSTNPSNPFSWTYSAVTGAFFGTEASGTDPIPVEGTLTSLTPGTEYAVRLVAENPNFSYYVESPLPNPTFTTLPVAPPTVTMAPPSAVTARTAHFEADIDPGGNDPAFNTSWFFSCTPACPGVEGTIPGDGVSHHISTDASGLQAGTLYEVTLYATNAGGTGSAGPETFTTGTEQPTIEKVLAHPLTTEAGLVGEVDPGGLETSYYFEYGPTAAYGHSTPVKTLPAGGAVAKATANVYDLTPGSTYHYQLIAENADGSVESGDHEFTERFGAGGALPDGRAYELVSSEDTNLGDVSRVASSDDGSAVEYVTNAGLDFSPSAYFRSVSQATRGESGWTSRSLDVAPPAVTNGFLRVGGQVVALSSDLKLAVVKTLAGVDPEDQNGDGDFYLVNAETGEATWINKPEALPDLNPDNSIIIGASRDLKKIYFQENMIEQPMAGAPNRSIYEWNAGTLELASRDESGAPMAIPSSGGVVSPGTFSVYQSPTTNAPPAPHGGAHPVSDDGSTLFFEAASAEMLARRNGHSIGFNVSRRAGSEGEPCYSKFVGASRDGDLVYFVCSNQLTDAATEGGGLYSYRLSTDELALLTPDAGSPSGLGVTSALMSDDASHVYFIATAALTPAAAEGSPNLYVYSGGQTRFIASVPAGTTVERASRSGQFALLESTGSIAGADPAGHNAIYRYDDETQGIVCVSCRLDGAPSAGDASLADRYPIVLGDNPSVPRNITDSGDVFFGSSDELVPQDVTHAWDVYEYTEGAPHLLSSGHSRYDSYVEDNSDSGTDAFFITRSALLSSDQDEGVTDLYDARVGGGFPEAEPEAPECEGDTCQGELPSARDQQAPGTEAMRFRAAHPVRHRLISVRGKADHGSALLVVRVNGPGKLGVHGRGLEATSRRLQRAGSYRIRVPLTRSASNLLKTKKSFVVRAAVVFKPRQGSSSVRKIDLRFKG